MSCYICSGKNDDIKLDYRDMKIAPCGTCEQVIQECIDGYPSLDPEDGEVDVEVVGFETKLEEFEEITGGPTRTDY